MQLSFISQIVIEHLISARQVLNVRDTLQNKTDAVSTLIKLKF